MFIYLIFIFYQIITVLSIPFYLGYSLFRFFIKKPIIGSLKERIGLVPKSENKTVWIHAVSVGEVLSVSYLINKLKEELPSYKFYLTCGTLGGKEVARTSVKADYISFLPFDFLPFMLIAFLRIKPKSLIIVEADFWPNLLMISHFKKIPIIALNARLRPKTLPRYKKFAFILRPLMNLISSFFVQTQEDVNRFAGLGLDSKKISVLGDIKSFNVLEKIKEVGPLFKKPKEYKVLLVGSLHAGELDIYLDLFKKLKPIYSEFKLLLVPRHFHWKDELLAKLEKSNFPFSVWDETNSINDLNQIYDSSDVLVVFKLGVLFQLYDSSDIFCLGGTFVPIGGHNLLEPAVWSKVSLVGLYHENCADFATRLEISNGLFKVKSYNELEETINHLLKNSHLIDKMGENAKLVLEKEAFIVKNNLENIVRLL